MIVHSLYRFSARLLGLVLLAFVFCTLDAVAQNNGVFEIVNFLSEPDPVRIVVTPGPGGEIEEPTFTLARGSSKGLAVKHYKSYQFEVFRPGESAPFFTFWWSPTELDFHHVVMYTQGTMHRSEGIRRVNPKYKENLIVINVGGALSGPRVTDAGGHDTTLPNIPANSSRSFAIPTPGLAEIWMGSDHFGENLAPPNGFVYPLYYVNGQVFVPRYGFVRPQPFDTTLRYTHLRLINLSGTTVDAELSIDAARRLDISLPDTSATTTLKVLRGSHRVRLSVDGAALVDSSMMLLAGESKSLFVAPPVPMSQDIRLATATSNRAAATDHEVAYMRLAALANPADTMYILLMKGSSVVSRDQFQGFDVWPNYSTMPSGELLLEVGRKGGSAIVQSTVAFEAGRRYTLAVVGVGPNVGVRLIDDGDTSAGRAVAIPRAVAPDSTAILSRLVHVATGLGPVDAFIGVGSDPITLEEGEATSFSIGTSGAPRVTITRRGDPGSKPLYDGELTLLPGFRATLLLQQQTGSSPKVVLVGDYRPDIRSVPDSALLRLAVATGTSGTIYQVRLEHSGGVHSFADMRTEKAGRHAVLPAGEARLVVLRAGGPGTPLLQSSVKLSPGSIGTLVLFGANDSSLRAGVIREEPDAARTMIEVLPGAASRVDADMAGEIETIVLEEGSPQSIVSIRLVLRQGAALGFRIHDMNGRTVATGTTTYFPAGRHRKQIDVEGVASGTYLLSVESTAGIVRRVLPVVIVR